MPADASTLKPYELLRRVQALAQARKVYRQVEPAELEKISGSVHHGGIVAFVTPPELRSPSPAARASSRPASSRAPR